MKIVVLDDSKAVLLTIQALLEELGVTDDEVSLFCEGHKALEYIEQHGADIIFSDINMPGMDGFEFVGRILELSHRFVSTLFIVSADEHYRDINHMKNIGAKRFIRKPIDAKHFNHFVALEIKKYKSRNKDAISLEIKPSSEAGSSEKIDWHEELALRMGIKVKHIPRLIESFTDETKNLSEQLKDAIEYKYYEQIEKYAHSLKGSSGNMQFFDLCELSSVMERAAQDTDIAFDYHGHYRLMHQEIETILQQLSQHSTH